MDERQKMLLRKQEDERFVQGCFCVAFAVILEMLLFQVDRHYINLVLTDEAIARAEFIFESLFTVRTFGGIAFFAGIAWLFSVILSGKGKLLYPCALIFAAFQVIACSHGIIVYRAKGLELLLLLVPAWAGLGLVYFLYQVEFFISALFTSLGGIGLWLYRQISLYAPGEELTLAQGTFYVFVNGTLILILAGFFCVNKAWKNQGVLALKKLNVTLISDVKDTSSLWLVGISGVLSFLAMALAMALSSPTVAYYCTYILLGWLFILLVYFTVKLM